jgi:hypothetical protein
MLICRRHHRRGRLLRVDIERGSEPEITFENGTLVVAGEVPRLTTGRTQGAGPAENTLLEVATRTLGFDDGGARRVFSACGWSMAR